MSRTAENGNVDYDNKGATIFREAEERISRDPNAAVGHEHLAPTQKGFYGHVGNPGILGLAAHAVTLMLISTQFMGWRGVSSPQVYVGNLFFFAGLYMFTTAQWCLVKGESFAYGVYGVFSGFYLSYAAILTPAFNIAGTYSGAAGTSTSTAALYQSLGIYLMVWNAAFLTIFIASLRTNVALVIVFGGVFMGVFLLSGFYFQLASIANESGGSMTVALALSKAGGAFLFLSSCSGFYLFFIQLTESVDFPVSLPVGDLSKVMPKKRKDV